MKLMFKRCLQEPLPSAGKSRRAEGEPIEDSVSPSLGLLEMVPQISPVLLPWVWLALLLASRPTTEERSCESVRC